MNRREFLKLASSLAFGAAASSFAGGAIVFPKKAFSSPSSSASGQEGITGSIDDLLGEGVWLDSAEGVVPDGIFSPDMDNAVLPSMGLRPNDADFGWFYRHISQVEDGYKPNVSVSGNQHLDVYSSVRKVPGMDNVYFVDWLFRPRTDEAFSDNIALQFDQVDGIDGRKIYQKGGLFEDVRFYPNPSNGPVTVEYYLSRPASVKVQVFDLLGKKFVGERSFGPSVSRSFTLGEDVSSGVYLVRLVSEKQVYDFKLSVVK